MGGCKQLLCKPLIFHPDIDSISTTLSSYLSTLSMACPIHVYNVDLVLNFQIQASTYFGGVERSKPKCIFCSLHRIFLLSAFVLHLLGGVVFDTPCTYYLFSKEYVPLDTHTALLWFSWLWSRGIVLPDRTGTVNLKQTTAMRNLYNKCSRPPDIIACGPYATVLVIICIFTFMNAMYQTRYFSSLKTSWTALWTCTLYCIIQGSQ